MTGEENNKTKPAKTQASSQHTAKKAAVLGTNKKHPLPLITALCAVTLIGALVYVFGFMGTSSNSNEPVQASLQADKTVQLVTYPADTFADGKVRHYEYKTATHTIRYFILQSSDGVVRAAFDACDVCWPANKGYFQSGDAMVCRNCGRRFASVLVNEVQGGCNPAPLSRNLDNDQIVIKVEDILKGRRYFDFKTNT